MIRLQDLRGGLNELLGTRLRLINAVRLPVYHVDIGQLDIEADEVPFARYDENAAVRGVDHSSRADIGEVGLWDEVHNSPHEL